MSCHQVPSQPDKVSTLPTTNSHLNRQGEDVSTKFPSRIVSCRYQPFQSVNRTADPGTQSPRLISAERGSRTFPRLSEVTCVGALNLLVMVVIAQTEI